MPPRGGRRANAGRKPGSNAYGEPTVPLRVPSSQAPVIRDFLAQLRQHRERYGFDHIAPFARPLPDAPVLARPLFLSKVPAGFPSPADDYVDARLDLNERLVRHPAATFFVRVEGDSMIGAGIHSGDILVVDRSVEPTDRSIVVAVLNGELTVKRLWRKNGRVRLEPENPDYPVIEIVEGEELIIWGVVTSAIREFG